MKHDNTGESKQFVEECHFLAPQYIDQLVKTKKKTLNICELFHKYSDPGTNLQLTLED